MRTRNLYSPFPEEFNRQATGIIAKYHFAPTENSKNNLLKEGKNEADIYVTGNTAIDALKTTVKEGYTSDILEWAKDSKLIVLTAHRRENLGKPLENMFKAIKRIVDEYGDIKVVYPVHKNPLVREAANKILGEDKRIKLIEPLEVIDFHNLLARAHIIMTDSGGIQEEAPTFACPTLVMRYETERTEGIEAGVSKLVGADYDKILEESEAILSLTKDTTRLKAQNPYGDGTTSAQIEKIIRKYFE